METEWKDIPTPRATPAQRQALYKWLAVNRGRLKLLITNATTEQASDLLDLLGAIGRESQRQGAWERAE